MQRGPSALDPSFAQTAASTAPTLRRPNVGAQERQARKWNETEDVNRTNGVKAIRLVGRG
eukprot:scaffold56505_cov24-Tisochrysis_lutea.AAC.1